MSFKSGLIHRCSICRSHAENDNNVLESEERLSYENVPCRVYRKRAANTVKMGANYVTASLSVQFLIGQDVQHNDSIQITGKAARLYPGRYRCKEPAAPNGHHWEAELFKEEDAPCLI